MKPFADFRTILKEETTKPKKKEPKPFNKDNLATLKNIVARHKEDTIEFSDGSELEVDVPEANAFMACYARMDKQNKQKLEIMLTKGVSTFMKLSKFCMSLDEE